MTGRSQGAGGFHGAERICGTGRPSSGGLNQGGPLPGYTCGADLEARLNRLLEHGVTREVLGHSIRGRPIYGYTGRAGGANVLPGGAARTSGRGGDDRPGILLISLLHPMEWIGLEANLALMEGWLLPEAGTGETAPDPLLLESVAPGTLVYSVPVANPDGFARVEESLVQGPPHWVRGNASRVDLNRNFPAGHRPRPRWLEFWPLYRPGPRALSEPETAALAAWVGRIDLCLSLSLHSYGRWIFYPPTRSRRPLPGTERHRELLRRAMDPKAAYRERQLGRWFPFFRARGTEIDFLEEETGGLAFLVEISRGGFARWGWRWHPFFLFNPPEPARELAMLLPLLSRLASLAGRGG